MICFYYKSWLRRQNYIVEFSHTIHVKLVKLRFNPLIRIISIIKIFQRNCKELKDCLSIRITYRPTVFTIENFRKYKNTILFASI
jgi:hypothetical protein